MIETWRASGFIDLICPIVRCPAMLPLESPVHRKAESQHLKVEKAMALQKRNVSCILALRQSCKTVADKQPLCFQREMFHSYGNNSSGGICRVQAIHCGSSSGIPKEDSCQTGSAQDKSQSWQRWEVMSCSHQWARTMDGGCWRCVAPNNPKGIKASGRQVLGLSTSGMHFHNPTVGKSCGWQWKGSFWMEIRAIETTRELHNFAGFAMRISRKASNSITHHRQTKANHKANSAPINTCWHIGSYW